MALYMFHAKLPYINTYTVNANFGNYSELCKSIIAAVMISFIYEYINENIRVCTRSETELSLYKSHQNAILHSVLKVY